LKTSFVERRVEDVLTERWGAAERVAVFVLGPQQVQARQVTCSAEPGTRSSISVKFPFRPRINHKMFSRLLVALSVAVAAVVFFVGSVEANKSPVITNKVYFDIQHGDEFLGRSERTLLL
jgi:hypothetical protein